MYSFLEMKVFNVKSYGKVLRMIMHSQVRIYAKYTKINLSYEQIFEKCLFPLSLQSLVIFFIISKLYVSPQSKPSLYLQYFLNFISLEDGQQYCTHTFGIRLEFFNSTNFPPSKEKSGITQISQNTDSSNEVVYGQNATVRLHRNSSFYRILNLAEYKIVCQLKIHEGNKKRNSQHFQALLIPSYCSFKESKTCMTTRIIPAI